MAGRLQTWAVAVLLVLACSAAVIANGIEIALEQTGNREMLVQWSESGETSGGEVSTYLVTFDTDSVLVTCSDNCFHYFYEPNMAAGDTFSITVKNEDTDVKEEVETHFDDIPSVSQLECSYSNEMSATISWACVDEASSYNVSLYDSSGALKLQVLSVVCSYTFDDPDLGVITDDVAAVQACTAESSLTHPTKCGDPLSIALAPQSEEQTTTIGSMEWKWNLGNSTELTVCFIENDLVDGIISLIVNSPEGIADYIGVKNSENTKCADFSDEQLELPSKTTIYKFQVADQDSGAPLLAGYVSYNITITQTLINCSGSEFARVTISNGNFADASCLPASEGLLVCYTTAQDPRVCVLDLDASNPQLQVCVTQTPADSTDISGGNLSGLSLNYEDGSLAIADNPAELMELLYRPQEGNASVASCSSGSCALANFSPSTDLYELCGVYGDTSTGAVTVVSTAVFQDLNLTVVDAETVLDFYFTNLYQEQIYHVYTGTSPETALGDDPIKLDCSGVPTGYPCYGFLIIGDSVPAYLAVGDVNEANAVITVIPATTDANPGAA